MSKNHLPLDIDIKQEVDSSFDSSLDDSDETWLYSPEGENYGIIHEDLEAWLGGAVNKVNYRTRSALARQLEKKKKKTKGDKEERKPSGRTNSLAKIEEDSCEESNKSCNESDKSSVRKGGIQVKKPPAQIDLPSAEELLDEDVFYDAKEQVTPRKVPSENRAYEVTLGAAKDSSSTNSYYVTAKGSTSTRNSVEDLNEENNIKSLSELERRAREQEKEIYMELNEIMNSNPTTERSSQRQQSRPGSTSSVASSNANSNRAIQHYNDGLSTSRSAVDFRHVATTSTRQSIASGQNSSRSNEDSLAIDLSNVAEAAEDLLNQTLASRLPLPRRQIIPGRTSIPLPSLKKSLKYRRSNPASCFHSPNSSSECASRVSSGASSVQLNDDDECF